MTSFEPDPPLPIRIDLDDHAGPAMRLPRDRAAAMVEAALADFQIGAAPTARFKTSQLVAAAAALVLVIAGGAAAARFYFDFGRAPKPATERSHALPLPAARPNPTPSDEPAQPAAQTSETESATAQPSAVPKAARASSSERVLPEDLLQRANHLRALGQFREAAQTYGQVYERFARSSSAYVARVAAASIELEHLSNPLRARRLFEQALRDQPRGALDLEARQGLCVALRDLEDRRAEARALQGLIQAHPDSPAARRAQVRLHETESEPR